MNSGTPGTLPDPKAVRIGVALTVLVHVGALLLFWLADSGPGLADTSQSRRFYLCDGGTKRCALREVKPVMRGLELSLSGKLDVIEAVVVPRLGMVEKQVGLPKLQKYEQPEKIQDAVNIERDNPTPEEVRNKAQKDKKAELDKRRKNPLENILGAPEDDDPRKRASSLDRIVGVTEGSTWGSGTEVKPGNVYAGRVAMLFKQNFVVPTSIPRDQLAKLKMRVHILRVSPKGDIVEYRILAKSTSQPFNLAGEALIQKFTSKEGGKLALPEPDPQTLGYINQHGIVVDLDGSLFQE
jgi:hypothetical protein